MAEEKKKKPKRVLCVIKKNLKGIHHVVWGKGKRKFFIAIGVTLAILFVLLVITLEVTSKPGFCATCHYMEPYYENWQNSSHSEVTCTDCHFPPGIKSKIEGKFTALSMLVNYFTGVYKKSKPRAEIADASCLRGGCHSKTTLGGIMIFKQDIHFNHKPHLENLRRGKNLRCTSCHSQIVQGEHISVTENSCFLCHFKQSEDFATMSACDKCHQAPVAEEGKQVIYDHKSILERKIECQKCHGKMSVGDGHAPKERCSQCHAEEQKIRHYNDAKLMHKNHVTNHKIECRNCHTEIQHKSVSRSELVKPDCRACHSEFHETQLNMFAGKGGKHVPEHPSSMFEAGLNCQGCHIIHISQGDFELNGKSSVSNASVCDTCHGKGYSKILNSWSAQTNRKMGQLSAVISTAKSTVFSVRAHKNLVISKNKIADATFNYNLVKHGRSVHNIIYANQLMQKSYDLAVEAVKNLGLNVNLPYFEKSSVIPGECSNCHSGMQQKTKKIFGWNFPHSKHVTDQKMVCAKCHSNEGKHGQMIMKRDDCMSCHHQHAQENCADCHKTQLGIYKSEMKFSTLDIPNPMVNDVSCQDCHLTEDKKLIRPKVDSCIACHDEDYAEIYNEWLEQSDGLMNRLRKKFEEHNMGKDSNASKLLLILEEDGSKGIHNPDLYQQLIEDALK